jgi:hypothetical protein
MKIYLIFGDENNLRQFVIEWKKIFLVSKLCRLNGLTPVELCKLEK